MRFNLEHFQDPRPIEVRCVSHKTLAEFASKLPLFTGTSDVNVTTGSESDQMMFASRYSH